MFFKQIRMRGDNLSYVIADESTREAAVVDPGFDAGGLKNLIYAENLNLILVIITHDHIDHVVGVDELRLRFGAKVVANKTSRVSADVRVGEGDVISVGTIPIKVIHTPGHSADSICLLVEGKKLLTGDTLFVGTVGFPPMVGGDLKALFESLFKKLLLLDDKIEVYPGHDRGAKLFSTLGEEKRLNKMLKSRNFEEFAKLIGPI